MFIKAFILAVRERIDPYRGAYRCNIHAVAESHSNTHKHTSTCTAPGLFIFTIYGSKQTVMPLISAADSGSDLRNWMTRGNHIGPRYDRIRFGTSFNGCTEIKLDHVLSLCTGGPACPCSSCSQCSREKGGVTQLPASCFWQKQYQDVCDYFGLLIPC